MKKLSLLILSACFTICNAAALTLESPDGTITVVTDRNNAMHVSHNGTNVLDINNVGLLVNGKRLQPRLNKTISHDSICDDYMMLTGKRSHCHNLANQYTFAMGKDGAMQLRVYNDGVALRYLLDMPQAEVGDDLTAYCLNDAKYRWQQKFYENYEDFFPKYDDDSSPQGEWGYPLLYQVNDDDFMLITEANIRRDNDASHLSNMRDAGIYDVAMADGPISVKGEWTSPWRVAFVGDLPQIVESTLVTDLSDPSCVADTDWIKPGVVSWVYWAYNHGSNDYQIVKQYIDLAKTLHLPYVLIDAEWDEMGNGGDIQDAVTYALSQGVRPLIWYNSSTAWTKQYGAPGPHERLNDPATREAEFAKIASWGVAGVKIDFFKGDLQPTMEYCIDLLESAARHNLLVNFHGATIPRGWQRTYPNLMSVEAVYGAEWYNNLPVLTNRAAAHNATLPFTRNVIGPMDYTPCAFSDSQHPHITSKGHELALTVVYESALQHIADRPESLLAQPAVIRDFFGHLPSTWDDTRLLGGYPGELVAIARRSGDSWYVGILNGADDPKVIDIDWSRIIAPETSYQYTIYADHSTQADNWHVVSTYGSLPTSCCLAARGGAVLIVEAPLTD